MLREMHGQRPAPCTAPLRTKHNATIHSAKMKTAYQYRIMELCKSIHFCIGQAGRSSSWLSGQLFRHRVYAGLFSWVCPAPSCSRIHWNVSVPRLSQRAELMKYDNEIQQGHERRCIYIKESARYTDKRMGPQ